jgi:hypothetical protein
VVAVVLEMDYEPVSEGCRDRCGYLSLDAASPSREVEGPQCEHLVSEIAHVGEVKMAGPVVCSSVAKPLP